MSRTNKQWVLAKRPHGMISEANWKFQEAPVPALGEGEVLVETLYLSCDPTQRGWMEDRPSYMPPVQIGEVMRAGSVGRVLESRSPLLAPGDVVEGMAGWQQYSVTKPGGLFGSGKVPAGLDPKLLMGVLGVTGLTAYFGLLDLGQPKAGETVVVSGAAGATGSIAGQIARLKGCKVIGIAGGPDKCAWLTKEARFDAAIDYKRENVGVRLAQLAPQGVDVYFDNVGGDILDAVLAQIRMKARVVLCGGISAYNEVEPPPGPRNLMNLVIQRGRMEGFIVIDYAAKFGAAREELKRWVDAGELVHQEDIVVGIERAPEALMRLFTGKNLGKQLIQVAK
ncbi:MAG: NADP-dependent oxidoreductase [Deltaproteobacteria bacterium]|nr:NADP-dependent oxidoreductase [Deltaproteobacteria bacterium]